MAKKWTTLRKVATKPEEENVEDRKQEEPLSHRTPRRRLMARQQSSAVEEEEPVSVTTPNPDSTQTPFAPSDPDPGPEPEAEFVPEPAPVRPLDVEEPRVLVVHDAAATYRLVEETFGNFTRAKVDSTPDILNAFELAIRRDYQLFVIAMNLPGMSGNLFYEMVARGCSAGLGQKKLAPAVVFVRDENDPLPSEDLIRDVRVKAVWTKPLNIERMLDSVSTVIKRCDPAT